MFYVLKIIQNKKITIQMSLNKLLADVFIS